VGAGAMARSRRAFKKTRSTVRVGLPKRKSAKKSVPEAVCFPGTNQRLEWDEKGTMQSNYKALGILANPNVLGARSGTQDMVQLVSLQKPLSADLDKDFATSDEEPDDVKSALHKKRKDGKKAPLQRLTTMQRVYVSRLILKHGDNHEVRGLFCYGYSLECQFTSGIYASDIKGIFTSCAGHVKGHKVESHATSTWDT
jgi:hypothetical protein